MSAPRLILLVVAVAAVGIGAGAGAALLLAGGEKGGGTTSDALPAGNAPTAGERAPRLVGTDPVTGEAIRLTDFRGKPVVLTVWASWCNPCRRQSGALRRLARMHPEAALLGIDVQDDPAAARSFYEDAGWEHPSIADPDGRLSARLGVANMPTTYFLTRDQRIAFTTSGATGFAGLEHGLAQAKAAASE